MTLDEHLQEDLDFLIHLLDTNRIRHQKAWEKIRLDRVPKLFPDSLPEWATQVIDFGLSKGKLKLCSKSTPEGSVNAVKLTTWFYRRG